MYLGATNPSSLQSTIAAATSHSANEAVSPHHPITCISGDLFYEEDGTFRCEHAKAPADDIRTQQCLHHTLAILIVELACAL